MDLQETLWSLPITGGSAKRLTDPFLEPARPDWSPKGDLVAFQSFKGGTFHIWLMKPDGSAVRQLTEGHGDDREPRFSPDGNQIAFSSDRAFHGNYDIWVVDVATGKLTQWTSAGADEFEPAWSPEGSELAWVSGSSIQAGKAGAPARTLVSAPAGSRLNSPAWGPDNKIAYTEFTGRTTRLMISGKPASNEDDVFPFTPRWLSSTDLLYTANGKILINGKAIPFEARFDIKRPVWKHRTMDFDSTAPRTVKGIMHPALSPDGGNVAFIALNQLWVMPIGGKPRQLTSDSFYKQSPAWSPDGSKLAFCTDQPGTAEIYTVDVATGSERRITTLPDSAQRSPVWSPDGTKIAFQKQDGSTYSVDVATRIVKTAIPATYEPGKPSWAKNGTTLSIAALRPYSHRFREGTSLIQTVNTATGKTVFTEPAPYKSISTRGADGPIYSPDGTRMTYVMDGYLWVRPVDADGIPTGEARPINEEITDSPTWSGDGSRILYLSNGKLRLIASDGSKPPETVALNLTVQREPTTARTVIHAGRLWDGLGTDERTNVDITIAGRRIEKIAPHSDTNHQGREVIDASNLTVMPGLWEAHNHGYGGLDNYGDRAGRLWLAYGFTDLESQGDGAYGQMEIKESFLGGRRVGPRYFSAGEPIDGERGYYAGDHGVTADKQLQMELSRAQLMEYDSIKTYVRLPHDMQLTAMKFAHEKLGVWAASHYGLPGLTFGMDGMTHISATSRWGYSYTRSAGGVSYSDIRKLFGAAGEFIISTPFTASAMYAEDPGIVDDVRLKTLNPPWQQRAMTTARDRAVSTSQAVTLENLKQEEETLIAVRRAGGTVVLGTDSPLAGLAILNHLGLRAEVKFGMKPWEALQTATILPARTFGYEKDLGSVEPGKLADLVMVAGDPLRDIRDAARVERVMVGGRTFTIPQLLEPYRK
jgi:Tol biopolymer transport system component